MVVSIVAMVTSLGVGLGMCEKGVAAAVGVGVMDGVLREVFFLSFLRELLCSPVLKLNN
jgi:hypothetical protein